MVDLPEYFRAVAEAGDETGLISFSYDARRGNFQIAGRHVPVGDFDPDVFDPAELGINDAGIDARGIGRYPLYLTALPGRLLATPMLHNWANPRTQRRRNTIDLTRHIVCAVYARIQGDHGGADSGGSGMHTDCSVEPRTGGGVHVQTIGNCACLGLAADGIFVHGFQDGYGEYELHNTDTIAQRTSLYAGLGHLAHMATRAWPDAA